jgi:hypothetical protein
MVDIDSDMIQGINMIERKNDEYWYARDTSDCCTDENLYMQMC